MTKKERAKGWAVFVGELAFLGALAWSALRLAAP
jgi:hypothetical protein